MALLQGSETKVLVFLSWSTSPSRRLAEVLRDWLPEVIQEVRPWMSSEDISIGERWTSKVAATLAETSQGIICITPGNSTQPWLNFEAGALAKSLDNSRVRPVLHRVRPSDLVGPLTLFQAAVATDRPDMLKLLRSLNDSCDRPLSSEMLVRAFGRLWDDYVALVNAIELDVGPVEADRRSQEDVLAEILDVVRGLKRGVAASTISSSASAGRAVPENRPTPLAEVPTSGGRLEATEDIIEYEMGLVSKLEKLADLALSAGRKEDAETLIEQAVETMTRVRSQISELRPSVAQAEPG